MLTNFQTGVTKFLVVLFCVTTVVSQQHSKIDYDGITNFDCWNLAIGGDGNKDPDVWANEKDKCSHSSHTTIGWRMIKEMTLI